VVIANPPTGAETQDDLTVQAPRCTEIDVFEGGVGISGFRIPQAQGESPLLARGPFRVDEQAEAVVKPEFRVLSRAALMVKRRGHRRQV
jgi:hypothetical protein